MNLELQRKVRTYVARPRVMMVGEGRDIADILVLELLLVSSSYS